MLEPLDVTALASDPDLEGRPEIHFARSVENTLYTIRNDTTLWAWQLDAELVPTRSASTPTTTDCLYEPVHQVYDGHLILRYETMVVAFDIREPTRPTTAWAMKVEDLEGCIAVNGRLHVQLRFTGGVYRYGSAPFPAPQATQLELGELSAPDADGSTAQCALARGPHLYWVTQDAVEVRTTEPDAKVATMRLDTVVGYPILVGDDRLAVLEIYDDARNAVVFADVTATKPKRLVSLCKNHLVRSWVLAGTELYIVMRKGSGKKAVTTLRAIDVTTMKELWSAPLPVVEANAMEYVLWLGIRGELVAVLQGNGQLHRFRIKR